MIGRNRIWNVSNPHQGSFRKVLCLCSAGLLRSPTAARILSMPPFEFNTRAVGMDHGHALIPVEGVHLHWADAFVVMDADMKSNLNHLLVECGLEDKKPFVHNISVPDNFAFRDPELERIMLEKLTAIFLPEKA